MQGISVKPPMGAFESRPSSLSPHQGRALWPWLLGAALVFLALLALGTWQLQRMVWKHELVARVDARIHATPVPVPGPEAWPHVGGASHEYMRVRLSGHFLHDREALVQATTVLGAGFWVLTPLQSSHGTVIWVNRGFVPPAAREPSHRGIPSPEGEITLTGLMRMTEPGGAFLRDNDPRANRWHSRDVEALTLSRGLPTEQTAPFFVDQESAPFETDRKVHEPKAGQWPVAGLTVVRFADNHLLYALTWYGLALGLLVAVWLVWRDRASAGAG